MLWPWSVPVFFLRTAGGINSAAGLAGKKRHSAGVNSRKINAFTIPPPRGASSVQPKSIKKKRACVPPLLSHGPKYSSTTPHRAHRSLCLPSGVATMEQPATKGDGRWDLLPYLSIISRHRVSAARPVPSRLFIPRTEKKHPKCSKKFLSIAECSSRARKGCL